MEWSALKIAAVLMAAVAFIGALAGLAHTLDAKGYKRGVAERDAIWQARGAKELAAANAQILLLEDTARMLERKAQTAVTNANDLRRKADEAERSKVPAAANTVAVGLAGLCNGGNPAGEGARGGPEGATAANTLGPAGTDRADIFAQFGDFLSSEAARADSYARKLIQAVEMLRVDRNVCNSD